MWQLGVVLVIAALAARLADRGDLFTMQAGVMTQSTAQVEQAKAKLLDAEVRLLGLNQVLKARQTAMQHTQRKREQRHTDEFAGMQHARSSGTPMSGEKHDN